MEFDRESTGLRRAELAAEAVAKFTHQRESFEAARIEASVKETQDLAVIADKRGTCRTGQDLRQSRLSVPSSARMFPNSIGKRGR